MRRTSSSSETVSDTYQRRTIWNIIVFLWYLYLPIIISNLLAFCSGSPAPISIILRMIITFETDSDVIIFALEKIILYARQYRYIFIAHCVWWLASTIGLEQWLIIHIDNFQPHSELRHSSNIDKQWIVETSEDIEGNTWVQPVSENIHLDRISLVDNWKKFLGKSENQWQCFDPLHHTRKRKLLPRKLAMEERKRLNIIIQESLDSIRNLLKNCI
jgi:hypothetical protein